MILVNCVVLSLFFSILWTWSHVAQMPSVLSGFLKPNNALAKDDVCRACVFGVLYLIHASYSFIHLIIHIHTFFAMIFLNI